MTELLSYQFFTNALLAAVFASISCGIIGTYIVSKRIVFISGGITHASFGGIGLGYFLGFNPVVGAMGFGLVSAWAIEYLSTRMKIREDSAIAILWSLGMALGIIFVYLTPGYAPNLMSYLFGSILTVSVLDIVLLSLLSLILILFFSLFFRSIILVSFDENFARSLKFNVSLYKYILISLVALTIVLNIRVVGIILVLSLLTIPQTVVAMFSKDYKKMIVGSVFIGFIASLSGLLVAYFFNIPSGASIIFTLVVMYLVIRVIKWMVQRVTVR